MHQQAMALWQLDRDVGHIVLNRPQAANALNMAMAKALGDVIGVALRSPARALVLSARGKQFCAGGDIHEFAECRADFDRLIADILDILHPAIHALATAPMPVISALQGPIGGAGISVALCADIVLAAPALKLRGGYSAIGLSPDLGASYYLSRRAGSARAKKLLMTNGVLSADQCLQWGLVDELQPAEALMPAALAMAETLARGSTPALGNIKRLCDAAHGNDLHTHLALERESLLRCSRSSDGIEGVAAFVEKRPPNFTSPRID